MKGGSDDSDRDPFFLTGISTLEMGLPAPNINEEEFRARRNTWKKKFFWNHGNEARSKGPVNLVLQVGFHRNVRLHANKWTQGWKMCFTVKDLLPGVIAICPKFNWFTTLQGNLPESIDGPFAGITGLDFVLFNSWDFGRF